MLTIEMPRSPLHFADSTLSIAVSSSAVCTGIWFGRSSSSDSRPSAGDSALMNSCLSWASSSPRVYSRVTLPQTFV